MSYDEKLLREFVRHSLDAVRINEVLKSDAIAKGHGSEGESSRAPKPLSYGERWGSGDEGAIQAKGVWGKVFGLPQSFFDLKDTLFGRYSGGWCDDGRSTCPGLFPAIIDVATKWGKKLIDVLFNTANPPPTNASAQAMGAGLFPKLKSYYTNPTPPRAPTTLNLTESMTWNEVSVMLEQGNSEELMAVMPLIEAVQEDLQNIEGLVQSIDSSSDLLGIVKVWQSLTGDSGGTRELSDVLTNANDGTGISDADFGLGGISSVVDEFINTIVKPMISGVVSDTLNELVNMDLPPQIESAIKVEFERVISKIS